MNTEITESEMDLKRQDFRNYMNQRLVEIERDILILEIAKRLKSSEFPGANLSDEFRFSEFAN